MVKQVLLWVLVGVGALSGCSPESKNPEMMVRLDQVKRESGLGIKELDKAIRNDPQEAGLYKLRGRLFLEAKNYPAALADIEEAIKLKPGQGELFYLQARAQRALGQVPQALASARRALALQYETADVHVLLGETLLALQDENGAIQNLNEAIRLNPEHPYAYHYKGIALAAAGDTLGALYQLRRALQEEQKFTPTYTALVLIHQGRKTYDLAHRFLRQALALEPRNGHLWYLSGLTYEGMALPDSASASYRKASLLDPVLQEQTAYRLAKIAYAKKEYGAAIQHLLPVLEGDQGHDAVRWMLADSYEKNGQWREALDHYLILKDKNPADRKAYMSYWQLHQRLNPNRPAQTRTLIPLIENKSSLLNN